MLLEFGNFHHYPPRLGSDIESTRLPLLIECTPRSISPPPHIHLTATSPPPHPVQKQDPAHR